MVDGVVVSYNKLWKLMVDKGVSKQELRTKSGVTKTVMAKLGKGEPIHLEALIKICKVLQCDIGDVVGLPMVRHIIIWKLKDTVVNKEETMKSIKDALEGLVGKIAGLEKMSILIDKLPSSSGDLMMDSLFTDNGALKNYQNNPMHLEVANGLVRPNVDVRLSFDFEV